MELDKLIELAKQGKIDLTEWKVEDSAFLKGIKIYPSVKHEEYKKKLKILGGYQPLVDVDSLSEAKNRFVEIGMDLLFAERQEGSGFPISFYFIVRRENGT
jgi:hypothetical protein